MEVEEEGEALLAELPDAHPVTIQTISAMHSKISRFIVPSAHWRTGGDFL